MAKRGKPAKTAKGPVPTRKKDSSLSAEENRYGYIYEYADKNGKGHDWARNQISKIAESKGDKYLAADGKLVSRKKEKAAAVKARKEANLKIEKERILKEISDITDGNHVEKYKNFNLEQLKGKLKEWEGKAKILDSVRSEQGDEVAKALLESNPVDSKWEVARKVAEKEALTPQERNLYQEGYDELVARRNAGITNEGRDFSEAERTHYTQGDYDRNDFRTRFIVPGPQAPELYGWQQSLNAEINNLVREGLLDPDEAKKFIQEWGHRGSVSIPGYASRGNYESNVNSESKLYNRATGHGMTLPEVHNSDIHMSSGEGYTLSEKSKQHLDELIRRFPDSSIAKKAQAVIDNVPMSDIIDISDPNRDALFGGDPRNEDLLFFSNRKKDPGAMNLSMTPEQSRSAIHYQRSLKNFDYDTHHSNVLMPNGVNQADIDRIRNSPDFVNEVYFDAVGERLADNAANGRVESTSKTLEETLKKLAETNPEIRKQIGSANLKALAALTVIAGAGMGGVAGVAKLTGMSEEEKDKMYQGIVDKAMGGLAAYGEVVDSGYEAFEQVPGYNSVTGFYDNAVDWLNNISNKGGVSQSGGYYGEDGSWVAGKTFDNTYGAGDLIDTGIQTVNPADEVAAVTGLIRNIWNNNDIDNQDSGGGGF